MGICSASLRLTFNSCEVCLILFKQHKIRFLMSSLKAILFMISVALLSSCNILSSTSSKSLFNGENLDGWQQRNGTAVYKVENGEI